MKAAPWLAFACASAAAVFMAVMYLGNPRVETKTVEVPIGLNQQSTVADVKAAFKNITATEEGAVLHPNGRVYWCRSGDSTGDPEDTNFEWFVQVCVAEETS